MKVLVVSHNVFSKTNNMGKTLSSYFSEHNSEEIAQFFIHSEVPTTYLCENYFRITDKDALKSIITRRCGKIFAKEDIEDKRTDSRIDQGLTAKMYQKAQIRTPLIYLARNFVWKISGWKNKKFLNWVDEFDPDAIFFASGDYSFMYHIAYSLAKRKNIPLFTVCVDDYYLYNANESRFLGKLSHALFMKQVKKTLDYSKALFTICEKMAKDYANAFGKECYVLHTSTTLTEPILEEKTMRISYIGNLDFQRENSLVEIGKALLSLDIDQKPQYIDVYSAEKRQEILKKLIPENGINFCGRITAEQVKEVMGQSYAVIHTESFDARERKRVQYSVSTKIADSLMSGTCLFAYGPDTVASMEYLIENEAAIIATSQEELASRLKALFTDRKRCAQVIKNAQSLAKKEHNKQRNARMIQEVMGEEVK